MEETFKAVKAVVVSIEGEGRKRYAVTKLLEFPPAGSPLRGTSSVTFSLSEWKGKHDPAPSQLVILGDIEKFVRGWRARTAHPVRAQQETATQKQNKKGSMV